MIHAAANANAASKHGNHVALRAPVQQAPVQVIVAGRVYPQMDAKGELVRQLALYSSSLLLTLQAVAPDLADELDQVDLEMASRAEWARLAQLAGIRSEAYAGYLHARISSKVMFGADDTSDDYQARAKVARFMMEQHNLHLENDEALDWLALLGGDDWWSCGAEGLLELFKAAPTEFTRGLIAGVVAARIERCDLA